MQLTLRPFVTTGVALTVAGAIAVAPMAPPPPAIQVAAPPLVSEALQLAMFPVDLVGTYTDLITNTLNSLIGFPTSSADSLVGLLFPGLLPLMFPLTPVFLPIVQQLFVNVGDYIDGVVNMPIAAFLTALTGTSLPALADALNSLLGGDVSGALQSLALAITAPIDAALFGIVNGPTGLIDGVIAIPTSIVTHLMHLAMAIPSFAQIAFTGIVGTPIAVVDGATQATQNVLEAIAANDPVGVLTALLAAPGVFADEALNANGGTAPGTPQGLLSPNGPIGAVLQIRNGIAVALDGPSPSSPAAAKATPETAAKTVTLNVGPTTGSSTPVTSTVPATTAGTSGAKVSPTSTPGSHLSTTVKTVTGQLNSTAKTAGDLGATHHGGKTTKK